MHTKLTTAAAAALLLIGIGQAAQANELYGTLKKIKDSGVITIGSREASVPFSYIGADGKPIGYSMDLCYKIVDTIKEELQLPNLKVKTVTVTGQTRIPLLVNGTIDMECGSTTDNLTRDKQIDYLYTTFITGTKIAVRKGSGIKEIEDLNGKSIALPLGSTNEKEIKALAKKEGLHMRYLMVKDHPEGWLALTSGRVDAYSTDEVLLKGLISKSKNPGGFEVVGRPLSYEPYGIMVRQDDSAFRDLGNRVLADLMRSGEIVKIYDKWFNPGPTNINLALGDELKCAFKIEAYPY